MGEVQEQRYVCKICNKSCVSGKSLGGHMRVHLALIAASKKAAEAKAEIKMEINGVDDRDGSSQLKESSKNQSNSGQEKVKNWEKNMDSRDGDQSNSYELRENPKKSWRICNLKHGVVKNGGSCKECGREFPSLRALSGHMRSHSIKKKLHHCKTCGKGFDSMRAMFGHMKSHSKRLRVPDDSADSLSDFEDLCPVRRKRSRIRYKSSSNPSFSSLNVSNCDVSEVEDVEEVAMCLMMLSRGVKNWIKSDSVQESESSDDGSVYFGGESSRKSKNFDVNNDDSVCDADRKTKMSLSAANAFAEKNVSEFDDLNEKRVDFEVSDETKVALKVCDDEQPSVSKLVESVLLNEFVVELGCADDTRSFGSTKFVEPGKDLSGANGRKNLSENEATDLEILRDFDRMQGTASKADSKLDQFECGENQLEQESLRAGTAVLESKENKEHFSCPICLKVFRSGQALGGHKRAHYTGCNESKIEKAMAVNKEFDLNFPVAVDEGATTELGLNLWWAERNREHEALMLTN